MGIFFSSDKYELDTTNIEYYRNVYRNCGMAGIYAPLPYIKKNKIKDNGEMNSGNSFNSNISITSKSSLNEIVTARHLSRFSDVPNSLFAYSAPCFSSAAPAPVDRSSYGSNTSSVYSIETISLD